MSTKQENIFLFVPNLIGYARILLAFVSMYFMPNNYKIACTCYVVSALLDAFDGHAARLFKQSTKFGAILDQLTDRCGTLSLCIALSNFYPKYMFLFQLSCVIDISCHWIYLHSSILQGKTTHKFVDMSENPIMRCYYTSKPILFFMCFGNELFFASLYLAHFVTGPIIAGHGLFKLLCLISTPVMIVKTGISLLHCYIASINISIIDVNERKEKK